MSDDLDFDMEVVGDDELNEMGADGASSSETDPRSTARDTERENTSSNHSEIEAVKSDQQKGHSSGLSPEASSADQKGNTSLSEFTAELLTGGRPKGGGNDEGDYVSIGGTQVSSGGQLEFEDLTYISEDYFPKVKDTQLRRHDILIVKDGSNTGDVALSWRDHADVVTNEHLFTLRLNAGLNAPFASYFLQSHEGWKQLKGVITGSAQLGLTKDFVSKVDVPELPLPEQRKIASVLYAVDQAIQKTEAIIQQAKRVKRGLMQDLMESGLFGHDLVETDSRFGALPKSWKVKRLKELGKIAGRTAPEKEDSECWGGDIPWATPSEITNLEGNTISKTEEYLTERALEKVSSNLLPPGSVLLTTRATVGACAVNTVPITTNQGFKNVVPGEDLDTWYAYYRLIYEADQLEARAKGSTFREVGKETVENFEIPVPSRDEQQRIGEILKSIDDDILNNKNVVSEYERLKKGLMQDLLTGEVRTADKAIDVLDEVVEHG